jgi:GNAT superfamily N-acetyltransferase
MMLRTPTRHDAGNIAVLLTELGYPATEEEVAERLTRLEGEDGVFLRVAELDGSVVGLATCHRFVSLHKTEPVVWLTSLVVSSEHRGEGIGHKLVAACEAWAIEQGAERLSLTSATHREAAHAFYLNMGYERTGVRLAKIF